MIPNHHELALIQAADRAMYVNRVIMLTSYLNGLIQGAPNMSSMTREERKERLADIRREMDEVNELINKNMRGLVTDGELQQEAFMLLSLLVEAFTSIVEV